MMRQFQVIEGYEKEYEDVLRAGLDALIAKKSSTGITFKEDNMIFQLKTHLGIKVELLSQQTAAKTKDIGIESYN